MTPTALIVWHGSRSEKASVGIAALRERLATRLPTCEVIATDLDNLAVALADLGERERVEIVPYFLMSGGHVERDIPTAVEAARVNHPGCDFRLHACLEGDPLIEDLLVQRLSTATADPAGLPVTGDAIEQRSHRIIDGRIAVLGWPEDERAVLRRVIHATADFSYAETLRIAPGAVAAGVQALADGAPVICDSNILMAGVTRTVNQKRCAIGDPETKAMAITLGSTRAAAAMQILAPDLNGAVVAIGNAPTALWKLLQLIEEGACMPACIIGMPVGFVGAEESKTALSTTGLPFITNCSPRGGSPAAAAAVNAMALLAKGHPA